ncbi:hypothetical protein [Thiohalocapsa halophila]|uniref:hypothetical protein n=1 Tax=Thiohalocapsa halophila TaxID=69359 RepID=UPI001906046E|nr:hypothetical protein [Thiohalocapsa halophila]
MAIILTAAAIWALTQPAAMPDFQPDANTAAPARAADGAIPLELPPPRPATLPVDESDEARSAAP